MARIFISYRRAASAGQTGRLYDRLCDAFGNSNVFMDTHNIPAGETFESFILREIDQCDVFLAVMAEGTLDRIHNADDWVRKEIAYALKKPGVRVIPVLVDNFAMPTPDDLPPDLRSLPDLNATFLRHEIFDASAQEIIRRINAALGRGAEKSINRTKWGVIVAILITLVLVLAVLAVPYLDGDSSAPLEPSFTPTLTETPSDTPTTTHTPPNTPTETPTNTATQTLPPSETPTPTDMPSQTEAPTATYTSVPTDTPQQPTQCIGTISGIGGSLNQVRVLPMPNSPTLSPIRRGSDVMVVDMTEDFGTVWYQIEYDNSTGWIRSEYIDIPEYCQF